jgi:glycerophosphoryl diester phosphodiesterase
MKIIGHRGAAGLVFENTIESILCAIDMGVEYVEIDVWKTTDNQIVVFHDSYLDRLTNASGFIHAMTYDEVKQISLNNGAKIPTLDEVLDVVKDKSVKLLVELKSEDAADLTLSILKSKLPLSQFIMGSFFHGIMQELKLKNPHIQTSIMFECVPIRLEEYLTNVNPDYVVTSIETFNDYLVNTTRQQNRKLVFYTVNTLPEIHIATKVQPYAIITNFPNLFIAQKNSPS